MSKPKFHSDAFIFTPTKLAAGLSAVTQRPVTFKRVPKVSVGGKPLQVHS